VESASFAEVFYERIGRAHTISGLVGAIWQVRETWPWMSGCANALSQRHPADEYPRRGDLGFPRAWRRQGQLRLSGNNSDVGHSVRRQ